MKDRAIGIVHIGDGWLAVEKPAGVSIHNAPGRDLRSLLAAQVATDRTLGARIDVDSGYGFNAVGRLDKDADGLVLLAWRPDVFAALAAQYARRETTKRYLVVLYGQVTSDSATISWQWSLSKGAGGRRAPAGRPPRLPCRTDVKILDTSPHFTLVACHPHTGRKHQIRRHAALAGHPVAGDRRYGQARSADRLVDIYGFDRIALHAEALTFVPPGAGASVTITSPGLPGAFKRLMSGGSAPPSEKAGAEPADRAL